MIGGELLVITLAGYPVAFCLGMMLMLEHASLTQKNPRHQEPWTGGFVVVMSLVGIVAVLLMIVALISGFIAGVR